MTRNQAAALIGVTLSFAAAAQASQRTSDVISSYLIVMKNPDYGPLGPRDLHYAQTCKDDLLQRISNGGKNKNLERAISRAEPGARELVAAAIDSCLRPQAEGVHVIPSGESIKAPLLR